MNEIRPIDANAAADKIMHEVEVHAGETGIGAVAIMIAFARALRDETDFPTIEAEPIIHCKDCAFWERKRVSCEGLARCRTGESGYRYRFGHDFCSRAQRREKVSEDEPVRHGRWIPTEYDSYAGGAPVWDKWECSECGHEHGGEEDTLTAFCPHCGAKMDVTDTNVGGKGGADNG